MACGLLLAMVAQRSALDETALTSALRGIPEVRLAYLFGSRARAQARHDSDIDLAVFVDPEALGRSGGSAAILRSLAAQLGRSVSSALLDIVVLNDAPPLLRQRVLRDGALLVEREPAERIRFVIETVREYQDGAVRREWHTRRRIERLAEGPKDGGPGDLLAKARSVARLLGKAAGVSRG